MKYSALFIVLLTIASCTEIQIQIDNPTAKPIDVSFSADVKNTVDAFSSQMVTLKETSPEVFINGNSIGKIEFKSNKNYLFNPTESKYYVEENVYGRELSEGEKMIYEKAGIDIPSPTTIDFAFLMVDTVMYVGHAKVDSNMVIVRDWDYDLFDDFPAQVETTSNSNVAKRKIYREDSFAMHALAIFEEATKSEGK